MKTLYFYVASFLSNAAILVFEISGGRLLAPYLGTSVEVWAGLIAIFLGSMAIGYYFGGRIADRNASQKTISLYFFIAGAAALLAWGFRDIIPTLFRATDLPLTLDALIIGAVIFLPTIVVLAAISPMIAKNLLTGLDDSARVVGTLGAVGTVGSIAGAVLTGLVLIPFFGVSTIMLGVAFTLIAFALFLGHDKLASKTFFLIMVALMSGFLNTAPTRASAAIGEKETTYSRIFIEQVAYQGREARFVSIDPHGVQCGMFLNEDGSLDVDSIAFTYIQAYDLVVRSVHAKSPPERALFLGGCNYSYPRQFAREFPTAHTDVVEIDPGMTTVAREYFGFDEGEFPSLTVIHEDARTYVNEAHNPYDLIIMDVFGSMNNIPVQVTTKEMFEGLSRHITEDGFVAINIIGAARGPLSSFTAAFVNTAKTVFPHVGLYMFSDSRPAKRQNFILIASKNREFERALMDPAYPDLALVQIEPDKSRLVLTDDYAPVEYLATKR